LENVELSLTIADSISIPFQDYSAHPFSHCGNILATTRQTWEEIGPTRNYFSMRKSDVEDFLKQGGVLGRHQKEETWAITISITRPPAQAAGWAVL